MVRKLSITVPDDLAERLDQEPDAEAFLIETARARIRVEQLEALYADHGITTTPEGIARARARRHAIEAEWPPERWAEAREQARQAAAAMFTTPTAGRASAA